MWYYIGHSTRPHVSGFSLVNRDKKDATKWYWWEGIVAVVCGARDYFWVFRETPKVPRKVFTYISLLSTGSWSWWWWLGESGTRDLRSRMAAAGTPRFYLLFVCELSSYTRTNAYFNAEAGLVSYTLFNMTIIAVHWIQRGLHKPHRNTVAIDFQTYLFQTLLSYWSRLPIFHVSPIGFRNRSYVTKRDEWVIITFQYLLLLTVVSFLDNCIRHLFLIIMDPNNNWC